MLVRDLEYMEAASSTEIEGAGFGSALSAALSSALGQNIASTTTATVTATKFEFVFLGPNPIGQHTAASAAESTSYSA